MLFFEQAQVQGLLGDDLLQRPGFPAQVLDLVAGRRTRGIPGQPSLAGFQKLLRPVVIQALGDALSPTQLRDAVSPRSPSSTMRIFSSAEYCLRVARRMSFTIRSDDGFWLSDFCLISTP